MQKNLISPLPKDKNELNPENLHLRVDQMIGGKQQLFKYHQRYYTMKGNENKQIKEIAKKMSSFRTASRTPNTNKRMFRDTEKSPKLLETSMK